MVYPKVSVIIPCYNGEKYLRAAIESALTQHYENVEVVVVNDGSTDDSGVIARSFGSSIIYVEQENRGLSAARNAAICASSGEYVTLLDADDILLSDCLANRVEILNNPEVGLVAGYFREIDSEGIVQDRKPELRKLGSLSPFRQAVRRNWGPPVGWTFRREAYERCGGFDPLLRSCEDWDFVIRVASRYRIGYDETVQVYYRLSEGQMSSQFSVMLDAESKVHHKCRAYAKSRWHYFVDRQYGRFELGRRILYSLLIANRKKGQLGTTLRLIIRYPSLLWVGTLSAITLLLGKRASRS
jgi:glycosyltransferase involved in cell wall biosynthesis